ncbi:uncharacterized protein LOC124168200 [Ischnura elegans]|uniref:uncharacterized protein LOC124168200 n=1 Tax=Ischnura elegans TaxID=197161 RepID=UPI001ED866F9|nr:uncharacterized protein LOC124168200 [Ischnura elegans]
MISKFFCGCISPNAETSNEPESSTKSDGQRVARGRGKNSDGQSEEEEESIEALTTRGDEEEDGEVLTTAGSGATRCAPNTEDGEGDGSDIARASDAAGQVVAIDRPSLLSIQVLKMIAAVRAYASYGYLSKRLRGPIHSVHCTTHWKGERKEGKGGRRTNPVHQSHRYKQK